MLNLYINALKVSMISQGLLGLQNLPPYKFQAMTLVFLEGESRVNSLELMTKQAATMYGIKQIF